MSKKSAKDLVLDQVISQEVKVRYVITSANFSEDSAINFEYPSPISETVPGMVIDLRLMLNRQQAGIPIPQMAGGYSDEDYPDFFKMSETELAQYRIDLAENMQEMSQQLHDSTKELERKQAESRNNVVTNDTQNGVKTTETKPSEEGAKP